jgi:hypothetical protein
MAGEGHGLGEGVERAYKRSYAWSEQKERVASEGDPEGSVFVGQ